MVTGAADDGVNVTEQVPETSVQVLALNDPDGALSETVPVGEKPVTETDTVVGVPTFTDDGVSVTAVVVGNLVIVRIAEPELGALLISPP